MNNSIKSKIFQMLDNVEDETILNQVMEDVSFYTSSKDIADELNLEQQNELDIAINEADTQKTISWEDFKNEMHEWRKR